MTQDISDLQEASQTTQPPQKTPVSVFGIIVIGLITGLVIGLYTPNATLTGFFLGFAGGAAIAACIALLVSRSTEQ